MEKSEDLKTKLISEEGVAVVESDFNRGDNGVSLRTSVLICTKDRSDMLSKAVESVLNASKEIMELIVVDQSTDDRSKNSLAPYMSDPRLVYVPDTRVGKGLALNTGLRIARGDIVALTDDDCVVSESWPSHLVNSFRDHPKVAVAFGNVLPAPYDPSEGFIPIYTIKKDKYIRRPWGKILEGGIGANMAVRREIALAIGGFDAELGPGGRFGACVDGDFALRSLLKGFSVTNVAESSVVHYGFRSWDSGSKLIKQAYYGIGASYVKPLKCLKLGALPAYLHQFVFQCLLHTIIRTLTFKKPVGFNRIVSYLHGTADGWRHPINFSTLTFIPQQEIGVEPSVQRVRV